MDPDVGAEGKLSFLCHSGFKRCRAKRAYFRKVKRKLRRQAEAKARDEAEAEERARLESSPSFIAKMREEEKRLLAEEEQREREQNEWIEREQLAQAKWREEQERKEILRLKVQKAQCQIREEWKKPQGELPATNSTVVPEIQVFLIVAPHDLKQSIERLLFYKRYQEDKQVFKFFASRDLFYGGVFRCYIHKKRILTEIRE